MSQDWTWRDVADALRMVIVYRLLIWAIRLCPVTSEGTRVVVGIERIAKREIRLAEGATTNSQRSEE